MRSTASGRRASSTPRFGAITPGVSSGLLGLRRPNGWGGLSRIPRRIFAEKISIVADWNAAINPLPTIDRTMDALLFSPRPRHGSRAIASFHPALFLAERLSRWRGRNFRYATGNFISARSTVPDRPPAGPDRRHRRRQSAGGGRLSKPQSRSSNYVSLAAAAC